MVFEVFPERRGLIRRKQWRWRLNADNGRTIADSGEGYNNAADALHGISLIRMEAHDAEVRVAK